MVYFASAYWLQKWNSLLCRSRAPFFRLNMWATNSLSTTTLLRAISLYDLFHNAYRKHVSICKFTSVWAKETRQNWVFIVCQTVCNVWLLAVWRLNYNDDDDDDEDNNSNNNNNNNRMKSIPVTLLAKCTISKSLTQYLSNKPESTQLRNCKQQPYCALSTSCGKYRSTEHI